MKNKFTNKIIKLVGCLGIVFSMTACNDWTNTEPLEIKEPNIAEQNPELYAAYLESIRSYKASHHKILYAVFNNKEKVPFSQAHRLSVLPDSIDIVSLVHPDTLAQFELDEIKQVKAEKGTKFVFNMDFEAIKLIYDTRLADLQNAMSEEKAENPVSKIPDFITFLVDTVNHTLQLVNKYPFDGISLCYQGKSILHMTEKEKQQYTAYETAFIGIAKDWSERNKDKMIIFEGYPQNLLNKSILTSCKYIVIPCVDARNASKLTYNLLSANVEGVPNDKFIVSVETAPLNTADKKSGYWSDGQTRSIAGASEWVAASHSGFSVVGLGIRNVNNDYFNAARIYPYTRDAISIINPSPKK